MKKLIVSFLSLTLLFLFASTSSVHAEADNIIFSNMVHAETRDTHDFSTTANSQFRIWFKSASGATCQTYSATKLKVTPRSEAGATGTSIYVYIGSNNIGYNAFYFGDEDVYYEVKLMNVSGTCNISIIVDSDY